MNPAADIQISVIVPVYNAEHHLRATLDTLLAQTFENFEIILVNDGSQDASLSICREYQAKRTDRIIVLDGPNQGVSLARNRGLDAARGKWVAFCDADDQTETQWLRTLYCNAVRDRADLSCCAFRDISPDETRIRMNFPIAGTAELLDGTDEVRRRFLLPLLAGNHAVHGYLVVSLFRRELIEKYNIRFTAGIAMKEDELFYMDYLAGTERITVDAAPLYKYIRRAQSATARHRKADAFRREKNWFLYADARLRIFRKHELQKIYPALEQELLLRLFAHRAQKICCDPAAGFLEKMRELRSTARHAREEHVRAGSTSGRIFLYALLHCRILLPLLCAVKRRREGRSA